LVEFSLILPIILMLLLGMLELGFAFDHLLTLSYASREGARTGAAMADGAKLETSCGDVDTYVVSAVERVLASDDSPIRSRLGQISSIRIFNADASGNQIGSNVNVWVPGTGPDVDGRQLAFRQSGATGWDPCTRSNMTSNPDSIGIRVTYGYEAVTPLAAIMQLIGGSGSGGLTMSDRSVMALNPTD
jgi:Flp pilus assembly protein TadG